MTDDAKATNQITGETVILECETPDQMLMSSDIVYAWLDAYRSLKRQLEERARELWRQKMADREEKVDDQQNS
jgi:hypothetical protein